MVFRLQSTASTLIYRFIEALKVEQTLTEANYEQAIAGDEPRHLPDILLLDPKALSLAVVTYNDK